MWILKSKQIFLRNQIKSQWSEECEPQINAGNVNTGKLLHASNCCHTTSQPEKKTHLENEIRYGDALAKQLVRLNTFNSVVLSHQAIALRTIFFYCHTWPWTDKMLCQGMANPPAWIIAKHRIQSALLPPKDICFWRTSCLWRPVFPRRGPALISTLCAWIFNYHSFGEMTDILRAPSRWEMSRWLSLPRQCQLFRRNSSWDTSRRPMPVQLPCCLWRRTREKEGDRRPRVLGSALTNVGGLPLAGTKCSYRTHWSAWLHYHCSIKFCRHADCFYMSALCGIQMLLSHCH